MPFYHSTAIRCSACRAAGRTGRVGRRGRRGRATLYDGDIWQPLGAAERAIVVGLCWRALSPNRVCAGALPVAPSYLRRPPTLPHKRPVAAALQDPDSARIRGLCAASNLAVYALPRAPFRSPLLVHGEWRFSTMDFRARAANWIIIIYYVLQLPCHPYY